MAGVELPLLDQTRDHEAVAAENEGPFAQKASDLKTAKEVHKKDPNKLFAEEEAGWHGYVSSNLDIHAASVDIVLSVT